MSDTTWQKSSFSGDRDDCVELTNSSGLIAIRESDTPSTVLQARARSVAALIAWQKSSFSTDSQGDCVELARIRDRRIGIRESDAPATVVATTPPRLRALLAAVKAGVTPPSEPAGSA
ncbi:DUF397 domain-containing protein [Streptomyces sp. UNOB3_S3]|uniref:DUF397 domain-containing protein n=1 Tax=Streptomyces sp. UNOB3_S3 TaxID=2871682 RepID=UPI0023B1DE2D|nr:DUF397 domain-containing protein [Streptomyces sp. UNOB3_S3]MCC3778680.1 DUF397 domain-containing protein [Streptomyces sp. UNOB3_S3]